MVSVCRDLAIVLAAEGEFIAAWQHVEAAERLGGYPTRTFCCDSRQRIRGRADLKR